MCVIFIGIMAVTAFSNKHNVVAKMNPVLQFCLNCELNRNVLYITVTFNLFYFVPFV